MYGRGAWLNGFPLGSLENQVDDPYVDSDRDHVVLRHLV
jgi:hypothetical protein